MSLKEWFERYSESHQNPINQGIHFLCVPVIATSIVGLAYPVTFHSDFPWIFNLASILILVILVAYARFSLKLCLIMAFYFFGSLTFWILLEAWLSIPTFQTSLVLFVLAWIGQFLGHKIEGKKPSFFEDLKFLLIGPAWVLQKSLGRTFPFLFDFLKSP